MRVADLVQALQLFARPGAAVLPHELGRVPVRHVALEALLALEEHLALVAPEQAHVVHLNKAHIKHQNKAHVLHVMHLNKAHVMHINKAHIIHLNI